MTPPLLSCTQAVTRVLCARRRALRWSVVPCQCVAASTTRSASRSCHWLGARTTTSTAHYTLVPPALAATQRMPKLQKVGLWALKYDSYYNFLCRSRLWALSCWDTPVSTRGLPENGLLSVSLVHPPMSWHSSALSWWVDYLFLEWKAVLVSWIIAVDMLFTSLESENISADSFILHRWTELCPYPKMKAYAPLKTTVLSQVIVCCHCRSHVPVCALPDGLPHRWLLCSRGQRLPGWLQHHL